MEKWDTAGVCEWLQAIGLDALCTLFAEEDINGGMLLAMTPTDLTELFGLNEDDVDVIFMAKEQIELGYSSFKPSKSTAIQAKLSELLEEELGRGLTSNEIQRQNQLFLERKSKTEDQIREIERIRRVSIRFNEEVPMRIPGLALNQSQGMGVPVQEEMQPAAKAEMERFRRISMNFSQFYNERNEYIDTNAHVRHAATARPSSLMLDEFEDMDLLEGLQSLDHPNLADLSFEHPFHRHSYHDLESMQHEEDVYIPIARYDAPPNNNNDNGSVPNHRATVGSDSDYEFVYTEPRTDVRYPDEGELNNDNSERKELDQAIRAYLDEGESAAPSTAAQEEPEPTLDDSAPIGSYAPVGTYAPISIDDGDDGPAFVTKPSFVFLPSPSDGSDVEAKPKRRGLPNVDNRMSMKQVPVINNNSPSAIPAPIANTVTAQPTASSTNALLPTDNQPGPFDTNPFRKSGGRPLPTPHAHSNNENSNHPSSPLKKSSENVTVQPVAPDPAPLFLPFSPSSPTPPPTASIAIAIPPSLPDERPMFLPSASPNPQPFQNSPSHYDSHLPALPSRDAQQPPNAVSPQLPPRTPAPKGWPPHSNANQSDSSHPSPVLPPQNPPQLPPQNYSQPIPPTQQPQQQPPQLPPQLPQRPQPNGPIDTNPTTQHSKPQPQLPQRPQPTLPPKPTNNTNSTPPPLPNPNPRPNANSNSIGPEPVMAQLQTQPAPIQSQPPSLPPHTQPAHHAMAQPVISQKTEPPNAYGNSRNTNDQQLGYNPNSVTTTLSLLGWDPSKPINYAKMTIVDVQLHTEGAGLFCKKYAVYEIDVVQDGVTWKIFRRYSQFFDLDRQYKSKGYLKKDDNQLPAKTGLYRDNTNEAMAMRCVALQKYFNNVINRNDIRILQCTYEFIGPFQVGDVKPATGKSEKK